MRIRMKFVVLVSAAAVLLSLSGAFAGETSRAGMQEILSAQLSQTDRDAKLLDWFSRQYEQGLTLSEADKQLYLELESRYGSRRHEAADNSSRGRHTLDEYIWTTTTYNWVDITGIGTNTGITLDDQNLGPFALGFSFPFYGTSYTSIRVCSNGFLSFTSTATVYANTAIPATAVPNNAVYLFWDDMYPPEGGQILYYADAANQRFIVSWLGIQHISGTEPYTYQAILYPSGNIIYQYQTIPTSTPGNTSCTVGIENATGTQALQVCYNGSGTPPTSGTALLIGQPDGVPNPVTDLTAQYIAPNVIVTWTDPTQDTNGNPITIGNVQVWLGAVSTGTLLATVPPGVQTYTHANAPAGAITYTVRAFANPYYGAAASISVMGGTPVYPNDFESDNGGWVADPPTGGWEWGVPTYATGPTPHSGTKVWGTVLASTYAVGACYKLTLAQTQPVNSPDASIEFWRWWDTELNYDGCNFKVSVDQGANWTTVEPTGGYGGTTNTSNACIPSESAWTGHTGGTWTLVTIPLGQFLGLTPMFRFSLGSDASLNYPGFYFDDMNITGLGQTGAVPRPPTNLSGNYAGANVTLTWTDPTQDINNQPMTVDSIQVWLGQVSWGTRLGSAGPSVQNYVHLNAPTGIRTYSIRAYNDGFPSTGVSTTVTVGNPSYVNNFNVNNGGWVPDPPSGGWSWGAPTNPSAPVPYSLPSYWGTGLTANYTASVDYKLDYDPGLAVQDAAGYVEFWYRFNTELTYDGCNFKASVDNGSTWTVLTPSEGAYTVASMHVNNVFMGGQPGWSGHGQTAWQHATIPIGSMLGQTPIFRFEFSTDPIVINYAGFFFDDMIIWGMQAPSSVTGTVRAFLTSVAIRGAQVWAAGESDTAVTDALGAYELALEPGTYTLWYRHLHFCDTVHTNVVVETGSQTVHNAVMRAPHGQVSATSLPLETPQGVNVSDSFTISNTGGQCPLSFSISDTSDWLSVDAISGTVLPNQTATIHAQATVAGMAQGDYVSAVLVTYNSTGSPADIRVDLHVGPNAVDANLPLPTEFAYHPNYPNPFNATTALRFDVPQQSRVQIAVFNIMGQEVARPVDNVYAPGRYHVLFDAAALPSGMYVVRMSAADYTKIGKMMLLK